MFSSRAKLTTGRERSEERIKIDIRATTMETVMLGPFGPQYKLVPYYPFLLVFTSGDVDNNNDR